MLMRAIAARVKRAARKQHRSKRADPTEVDAKKRRAKILRNEQALFNSGPKLIDLVFALVVHALRR